jgi:hypothetical protein
MTHKWHATAAVPLPYNTYDRTCLHSIAEQQDKELTITQASTAASSNASHHIPLATMNT